MAPLSEIQRIAACYPPEARCIPQWERDRYFSDTQRLAWLYRFHPKAWAEALSALKAGKPMQEQSINPQPDSNPHIIPHHKIAKA